MSRKRQRHPEVAFILAGPGHNRSTVTRIVNPGVLTTPNNVGRDYIAKCLIYNSVLG